MSSKTVTVTVPQELSDALDALSGLIMAVMAKKSPVEIATMELPVFIKLLGEYQEIPAQVVTQAGVTEVSLWVSKLAGQLLGLK